MQASTAARPPTDNLGPVGRVVACLATPLIVALCLPAWFAVVGAGAPMLLASLGLLGVMVALLVTLELTLRNPRFTPRPKGTWHVAAFYNGLITPVVAVALPSLVLVPGGRWLGQQLGTAALWPQDLSLAMHVWLVVILVDLTSYGWHRFEHTATRLKLPWRLHSVHHAPKHYDLWMGAQVHPVDVVVFALVGFTLMALLGAPVLAIEAAAFFAAVVGGMHHLAADTRAGVFNWLVPFGDHHALHHSVREDENGNFGNITTLFDQLFGSYLEPRRFDESPCGAWSLADDYPERDLRTQLLSPFGGAAWDRVARKGPKPTAFPPPVRPDRRWRQAWAVLWLVGVTAAVLRWG
ncbi:MAG: sterol desaturase family protein [Myxococcales bacterium]|nr:sterol desaturase family protein [Myxococcales bacterium]